MLGCRRVLAASILVVAHLTAWADQGEVLQFEIRGYELRGNSLLTPAEIDAAVRSYRGGQRSFGDIQAARLALLEAYQAKGYPFVSVDVPEQELALGRVILQVIEARIARVDVKNNVHFDEANIRRALPALQPGLPPDMDAVTANLRQSNDNPAKQITLKLSAGERSELLDAELAVRDESPWKILGSAANTGSAVHGRTQTSLIVQHANVLGLDHIASLQYTTAPQDPGRVKVYGLGYHVPLYAWGDSLDLYASYSNIDSGSVSAGLFDLAVSGRGSVVGIRYGQSLPQWGGAEAKLYYGFENKAYKNSIQFAGVELGNDVTVHPLSLGFQTSLALPRGEAGAVLSLVRNVPGGSQGNTRAFSAARMHARAGYSVLRASFNVSLTQSAGWLFRALANLQYTRDALVPGEQFGVGGSASLRGFQEREFSNDSGLGISLETYTPNLCQQALWNCRLLAFLDGAHLARNKALPGELTRLNLASAGFGIRLALSRHVNVQLDRGYVSHIGGLARADSNHTHLRVSFAN